MRLDVHTHGKLAKKLPFSTTYTDWLFGEARRAGLDALCLTEHFNTLQFGDLYRYLTAVSRRVGDCLELANGLRIFPGMETDVAEGGHILSIGPLEAILELNRRLEPHKEKETFLPLADLLDLLEQYPVLVGCAHPFRAPGRVPEQPMEQLRRFHFLDLNGKDMAQDRARTQRLTQALGKQLAIPVVAGSDTTLKMFSISSVEMSSGTTPMSRKAKSSLFLKERSRSLALMPSPRRAPPIAG